MNPGTDYYRGLSWADILHNLIQKCIPSILLDKICILHWIRTVFHDRSHWQGKL